MAEQKHVHKLKRHKFKTGSSIYFCSLPDCHYKIKTELAFGKKTICWRCGEEFIMNEYSIRLAKPHCEKCHKPKTTSYDAETPINPEIVRAPIPLPVEPLSGERTDVISSMRNRMRAIPKQEEEGDI